MSDHDDHPALPAPDRRTPLGAHDEAAAAQMWAAYTASHPDRAAETPVVDHFGDSAELADELLGLVLAGTKRATAALVAEFEEQGEPLPRLGSHWVACDGRGTPRAVLRSVELRLGTADSVDDAFAWDEGEDDRMRDTWLTQHLGYWRRVRAAAGGSWDPGAEVVFERFRVVWPPEHADAP